MVTSEKKYQSEIFYHRACFKISSLECQILKISMVFLFTFDASQSQKCDCFWIFPVLENQFSDSYLSGDFQISRIQQQLCIASD